MDVEIDEFPLKKSFGFSNQKKSGKTLEDARLNRVFMEQYKEMMRASHESIEKFNEEERNLRSLVGDNMDVLKEAGLADRRRSASQMRSAFGRRRARSQAIRRSKLNSQSLRSHMQHIRQSSREYDVDNPSLK